MSINNILSDDVLLLIFRFDRLIFFNGPESIHRLLNPSWRWHRLVHVCRKWRSVIFASPNFLDLKLVCHPDTRVELTGVWPDLPIAIRNSITPHFPEDYDVNAAIVRPSRVREMTLFLTDAELRQFASAMREPFPALIHLSLVFNHTYSIGRAPALPDGFLGGSASGLQYLKLNGILFQGLPKLLLSATHLVELCLKSPFHSGYISPQPMATCLSALTNLETFALGFDSDSDDDEYDDLESDNESTYQSSRRPAPPARFVLSALTHFEFKGDGEYLEDLVDRIDAPRLSHLHITFFHPIDFGTRHLVQFINRTPSFETPEKSCVDFDDINVRIRLSSQTSNSGILDVGASCVTMHGQLTDLVRICTSSFPSLPTIKDLYISERRRFLHWRSDPRLLWREFLRQFSSVKDIYISCYLVSHIASSLQLLVEDRSTVLATLQNFFLEEFQPSEPVHEGIEQFVVARRLSDNPITVSVWDRDSEQDGA